jgi:uncharacterized membrane-anchored protein
MRREPALFRTVLAALLLGMASAVALAAPPDTGSAANAAEIPEQILVAAMHQSIGAPALANIGDQATLRLEDGLTLVPREPAARLLAVSGVKVPPDFQALLLGPEGMDMPGLIRYVPAGFIDSDAALAWTSDDFLSSLRDTVARDNAALVKKGLEEREARRWIRAPRYNPESHQLSWAALILPKSAPRESDGEVTFHAIEFGLGGYIELTVATSVEKANEIGQMADDFLHGLNFRPGNAYGDALPADKRSPAGLAGAMGFDSLHKARIGSGFWSSDTMVPVVGGIVASIGALSLFIYIQRHLRREARRG